MKDLNHFKRLNEQILTETEKWKNKVTGNDEVVWVKIKERKGRATYKPYYRGHDVPSGDMVFGTVKELEKFINDEYTLSIQSYNKLKYEDIKPLPESVNEAEEDITDTEDTEEDITDTETDEPEEEEDADEKDEEIFTKMFLEEGFVKGFNDTVKQYVSETMLDDDFNSFTILPYIEIFYKDEEYCINVEFESAVTINLDDEGKVVESDIPDIERIKFKTPLMNNLINLENPVGQDSISVFIKNALKDIKQVPR